MHDREIIHWDKRLADQVKRGWDNYKHLHIDLGTARIDQSYLMAGEYLYVEESSSSDAIAKIRLNRKNNDELDLEKGVKIETVFIEIFITNEALEGEWLDLVFGINFKYKKKLNGGGLIGDSYTDAYRNANQAIPTGVWTLVEFDNELIDRLDEFDPITHQITIRNDGEYLIIFYLHFADLPDGVNAYSTVILNGNNIKYSRQSLGGGHTVSMDSSVVYQLVVGDILTVEVYHNAGVNRNIVGLHRYNHLQIYRLR